LKDPIIESGGWKSKEVAEQEEAGAMQSIATFLAVGSLIATYLGFAMSPWWSLGALGMGALAVVSWRRIRQLGPCQRPREEPDEQSTTDRLSKPDP
jgi:hypothetical protein